MKLAVLFWFYKEPEICINRLQLIKKYNPNIKIFGLYGDDIKKAKDYKNKLKGYLDDFFTTTLHSKPKDWKWINGDLMILDWYKNRGKNIKNWDSVAVVQWDALILGNIKAQFPGIKKMRYLFQALVFLMLILKKSGIGQNRGVKKEKTI